MAQSLEVSQVVDLLDRARQGCKEALGQLLEVHRTYLLAIAGGQLGPALRVKVSPSDLVQQSFLEAQRDFDGFQGNSHDELLAWLRQILHHNAANFVRRYRGTEKRELDREVSLDHSSREHLRASLQTQTPAPSEQLIHKEKLRRLEQALEELPSHYREVVQWRNLELQPFALIAQRLNRSEKAVQKLWSRAIRELQARINRIG